MNELKYREIGGGERKTDFYTGKNFNRKKPYWAAHFEGDRDGDDTASLKLAAKHFPPGTRVKILVPVCPKCDQSADLCNQGRVRGSCDFDWDAWEEGRYA